MAKIVVDVMLKPEILDPQGNAVASALPRLGFTFATSVRQGKRFEIEIDGINYCTNNEDNGLIYLMTADGDVGEKVGYLKQGEPFFDEDDK